MSEYPFKPVTIASGVNDEGLRAAFSYAEEQSPSFLFIEDLDSILDRTIDSSTLLNLLDGVSAKNGLFIMATANNISQLKPNLTDRPSRFDCKMFIPPPTADMAFTYLHKWFGKLLTNKKCKEYSIIVEKYGMSYAYLKEFYISSMFEALTNNRKVPTVKDIDMAMKRIVKDKTVLGSSVISMDKYTSK